MSWLGVVAEDDAGRSGRGVGLEPQLGPTSAMMINALRAQILRSVCIGGKITCLPLWGQ